jgi:hypothetical protein
MQNSRPDPGIKKGDMQNSRPDPGIPRPLV